MIPPGYIQWTVNFRPGSTGRLCHSVFGVKVASPPTQSDVDAVSTTLSGIYRGFVKTPGRYDGSRILIGQDGGDPLELNTTAGNGTGTTTTAMLTPQVMMMIRKSTALAGRKHRGRTFIPDVQESLVDSDGTIQSSLLTGYQTSASDLFSLFAAGPVFDGMVLLHTDSTVPTPVTSYTVQAKVATLRPRYER